MNNLNNVEALKWSQAAEVKRKWQKSKEARYAMQGSAGNANELSHYLNRNVQRNNSKNRMMASASGLGLPNEERRQGAPSWNQGSGAALHVRSNTNFNRTQLSFDANQRLGSQDQQYHQIPMMDNNMRGGPQVNRNQPADAYQPQRKADGRSFGQRAASMHSTTNFDRTNRVKVPPLKLMNKNNFFVQSQPNHGQQSEHLSGKQRSMHEMAKNLGSLRSADKQYLVDSFKGSTKRQFQQPQLVDFQNVHVPSNDYIEDLQSKVGNVPKSMSSVPGSAPHVPGIGSTTWAKSPNTAGFMTPEDMPVAGDLEPGHPLFDPAAHEQLLSQNYAQEEKLKMEMLTNQYQAENGLDLENNNMGDYQDFSDGLAEDANISDSNNQFRASEGQSPIAGAMAGTTYFQPQMDGQELQHLPQIQAQGRYMQHQTPDPLAFPQQVMPDSQYPNFTPLLNNSSMLLPPDGASNNLARSQVLKRMADLDGFGGPGGRSGQLNSDIDFDTNQIYIQQAISHILQDKGQLRRTDLSMQNMPVSGPGFKALRMRQQAQVYGQNLGKMTDYRRKMHAKTVEKNMMDLASKGKQNFIQNNINRITQQSHSKLDRLKKLQLQTTKLMTENRKLKTDEQGSGGMDGQENGSYLDQIMQQQTDEMQIVSPIGSSSEIENLQTDEAQQESKKRKHPSKSRSKTDVSKDQSKATALDKDASRKDKAQQKKEGSTAERFLQGVDTEEDDPNRSRRPGQSKRDKKRNGSGEDGHARNKGPSDVVSDPNTSPSNARYLRKRKSSLRARSQTAGGNAMRAGDDGMNRRKQQSALGAKPYSGSNNPFNRHRSQVGFCQIPQATVFGGETTIKKRKSTAGRNRLMGNFVGDRVQSSVTTNKPQFPGMRQSPPARRAGTKAPEFDVHSLPELDSNGDIKETRRSGVKLPQIAAKKKKKDGGKPTKKKAATKPAESPKQDQVQSSPASLSEHSKSININLTNSQALLNAKTNVTSQQQLQNQSHIIESPNEGESILGEQPVVSLPPKIESKETQEMQTETNLLTSGKRDADDAAAPSQKDSQIVRAERASQPSQLGSQQDQVVIQSQQFDNVSAMNLSQHNEQTQGAISDKPIEPNRLVSVQRKKTDERDDGSVSVAQLSGPTNRSASNQGLPPKASAPGRPARPAPIQTSKIRAKEGFSKDGSQRASAERMSASSAKGIGSGAGGLHSTHIQQHGQSMFNSKFQVPDSAASRKGSRMVERKASGGDLASASSSRPVLDSKGNVAYDSRHRKPKFVSGRELENYNNSQERQQESQSRRKSQSDKIQIEDPFARQPDSNTIWDHISTGDIASFIASQAFLDKQQLEFEQSTEANPLLSGFLIDNEFRASIEQERFEAVQTELKKEEACVETEYEIFGLKDRDLNMKADPMWIVNHETDRAHIQFQKSIKRFKGKKVLKLVFRDQESTEEWKANYDPFVTESKVATEGIDPSFQERYDELQEWRSIMTERINFDNPRPVFGSEVNKLGDKFWREAAVRLREKESWVSLLRQPKSPDDIELKQGIQDRSDMALILYDLKYKTDLKLPEPSWPAVRRPEPDEHDQNYKKYFRISPKDSRDLVQRQIEDEFTRIRSTVAQYELHKHSTFEKSADQSDYQDRMDFQEQILQATALPAPFVDNDEVYRSKQRNKIESMISPIDVTILLDSVFLREFTQFQPELLQKNPDNLTRTFPDGAKKTMGDAKCMRRVLDDNFNFEQCDSFYYQWYADHLEGQARQSIAKRAYFYDKKRLFETMASRQEEALIHKRQVFFDHHFSFKELQCRIYCPKWRNVRNPNEKLLKNMNSFNASMSFLLRQFPNKHATVPRAMKLGNNVEDLQSYFFMFYIDFTENRRAVPTLEDEHPWGLEHKLNYQVFRPRLTAPQHDQPIPYEYFEMTYPMKSFQDKPHLHTALRLFLEKRLNFQYTIQKKILDERLALRSKRLAKHESQKRQCRSKWEQSKQEKEKERIRVLGTRSWSGRRRDQQQTDELMEGVEREHVARMWPLTDDLIDLPENYRLVQKKEVPVIEPYEEPAAPFLDHLPVEYLQNFINQYQNEVLMSGKKLIAMVPRQQLSPKSAHLVQKETLIPQIGQHDPKKEQQRAQRDDCQFLKWIEKPLGGDKYDNLFLRSEDTMAAMSQDAVCKLFLNQSKYSEEQLASRRATKRRNREENELASLSVAREQRRRQGSLACRGVAPVFPQYFPLHLSESDAPSRKQVVDIWRKEWKVPPYVPPKEPEQIQEVEEEEEEEDQEAPAEEQPEVPKPPAKPEEPPAVLKLPSSENVLGYVDKQVRKEMVDAVKQGDVLLLSNFLDNFGRCLTERPDRMANYQSEVTGETVLHLALLMDYDTKEPVFSIGGGLYPSDANPGSSLQISSISSAAPKPIAKKGFIQGCLDLRKIKTALSNESQHSSDLKVQIVEQLITRAGANPKIKNFHNVSPQDIANNCRGAAKLRAVLKKAQKKY